MPTKTVPWFLVAAISVAAFSLRADGQQEGGFLVVINADNPVRSISRSELSKIFMRKYKKWPRRDELVRPLDLGPRSPTREAFTRVVHGKPVGAVKSYWQRAIFSGRDVPPTQHNSDAEVIEQILMDRWAVGYISPQPVPPGLIALAIGDGELWISGSSDEATSYALSSIRNPSPPQDEIVDQRGDVFLVLTGSCGAQGQGRHAVLLSEIPAEPVRVKIQTSTWVQGRFKSKSESVHTLSPRGDLALGCTRLSESTEKRFALAEVSDVAAHRVPSRPPAYDRPARAMVDVVSGATCGRDQSGQAQLVVNRHGSREISVRVETFDQIAGSQSRRTNRSIRLAPGAEKHLGCSAEGQLRRQFQILEAAYR